MAKQTNGGRDNKKGLGKGISALFENAQVQMEDEAEAVLRLDIHDISPMDGQPRQYFAEDKIDELAESIKEHGLIQPIVVQKEGARDYRIIAGERRWRACLKAGFKEIPAIVRNELISDKLQQALIENIQREDLNVVEEARAYARIMQDHKLTQDALALKVGKSRSAVANTLRLLKLPAEILDLLFAQELSEGHARALLSLPLSSQQIQFADEIIAKKLSVRDTEQLIKHLLEAKVVGSEEKKINPELRANIRRVEQRLSKALGAKVRLQDKQGQGRLIIKYGSLSELDDLIAKISSLQA